MNEPRIVNQVMLAIARSLSDGWQPSYWELRCDLGCHSVTIANALRELERDGVLKVQRRRGCKNNYQIVRQA